MTTARPHLLLVDDEESIRKPLATVLANAGYRVTAAANAAEARAHLQAGAFDLAILDIMMPGEDGLSLARFIRATGDLPVILLTARAEEIDRIVGLEMGADDYLAKPFNPRELTARIAAILRRSQRSVGGPENHTAFRFGPWILDVTRRRLAHEDGTEVPLTGGEFLLLEALVQRPGIPLSRDQLLDLTRGREAGPFDRAVDNAISRLRRKIEADPKSPEFIKTVHAAGYVLAAKVTRL
ncbi:response regulator [Porphyrobacter sp. YT40]|uniref:response regulator n=1 Tax=Porphyrobacter sp. YT40 TaxID=2547601 RepID=UPI0011448DBA|nr:response regulator [Porphyrobacter sp. YT40]QDH32927.1 response regulator [Porphyrobacter sp. YT40]